jgi:hypothetical protein
MLSDFAPSATISVKNFEAVRPFYEGSSASGPSVRLCGGPRPSA